MKRLFFLVVVIFCCTTIQAQADKAKYYIEGEYSISTGSNGQFVYQLTNLSSQGISFEKKSAIYGKREADESISFTFDKATTDCPDGFGAGLKFWKWQFDGKEYSWQRDSEVKDAQQEFETDKVMVVMLVLDCSNSLGEANFEKLKNSATKFINILYNASPDGSIRLGVVGFNTMGNADKMTRRIEPLTTQSRDEMIRFIQSLQLYNNTALYYAMRKGSDMIEDYVQHLSAEEQEKFDYACMVSFTDGYDNHSIDPNIGVPQGGLENPYYQYVRDHVVDRAIANTTLKSYVIAIRGNDVAENNELYKSVFEGLSSDKPILISDFNQLESQFENMAQELIKRWQNLTCYVPSAHQGKVRWTIGDFSAPKVKETPKEEPKPEPEPEPKRTPVRSTNFFGVSAGVELEFAANSGTRFFPIGANAGFDFAIALDKAAVGGLLSLKYCGPTHFAFGPLFLFGEYNSKTAFMLGAGLDLRFMTYKKQGARKYDDYFVNAEDKLGAGGMLRLGLTFPNHLYFFVDVTMGRYKTFYNGAKTMVLEDGSLVTVPTPEKWNLVEQSNGTFLAKYNYVNIALNIGYRFGKNPKEISFKDIKLKD